METHTKVTLGKYKDPCSSFIEIKSDTSRLPLVSFRCENTGDHLKHSVRWMDGESLMAEFSWSDNDDLEETKSTNYYGER